MGATQDVVSEEATTLVKDRTGLTVEAEVDWRRKKTIDFWDGGKEIFMRTGHRVLTVRPCHRSHNYQPRSLHNKIKCLSKTTLLSGSKSYRLVSTFVRSRHRALTVRPCHIALTTINLDHYTNTLDEACHRALTVRPAIERSQLSI